MLFTSVFSLLLASGPGVVADPILTSFPNSLDLSSSFDPIKAAYWTGLPHHRRTPFSVSPDGKSAYIAYLDSTYAKIIVQQVDTTTFAAVGTPYTTAGYEAGGLVAQNDGFALLASINATGTTDSPPTGDYLTAIVRVTDGVETWRTPVNGPGVHTDDMLTATTDINGDLVYSETAGLYAAYFVVTAYTTDYSGHFGDSIQYVDRNGTLQAITGASSDFGCSHNTGIGLEAAGSAPFASICAEDQGDIWLNTETQYMSGVKIANENTTNGCSGEPMGGMSGSYSNLALFPDTTKYIFAWQSRGALDLTLNNWMGSPYTQCSPRWLNHNVAIATMSDKNTLTGAEASSTVGAAEGDNQVNWITYSTSEDHQNVHVATMNSNLSIVTWETLINPDCQPVPLGCSGTYSGTSFQFVDSSGAKVGSLVKSTSFFVSGDIANVETDKVCWPYVDMTWDLSAPLDSGTPVTKMSFACASSEGSTSVVASSTIIASISTAAVVASSSSSAVVLSGAEGVVFSSSAAAPIIASTSKTIAAVSIPASSSVAVPFSIATLETSAMPETNTTPIEISSVSSTADASIASKTATAQIETSSAAGIANSIPTSFSNPIPSSIPTFVPGGTGVLLHRNGTVTSTKSKHHGHTHTTFETKVKPGDTAAAAATGADKEEDCE